MKKCVRLLAFAGMVTLAAPWCAARDFWGHDDFRRPPDGDRLEFFWDDTEDGDQKPGPGPRRGPGRDRSGTPRTRSDQEIEFQWETDDPWFDSWYES